MHMRAALLPLLALLALAMPFRERHAPMSFDEATKAAEANAATADGKVYAAYVTRHFAEQHLTSLRECTQTANEPEKTPFTMALRVGKKGMVEDVLVKPETRISICMARGTVNDHLKKPPSPSYWVLVPLTPGS
jgi:hypothetical protein